LRRSATTLSTNLSDIFRELSEVIWEGRSIRDDCSRGISILIFIENCIKNAFLEFWISCVKKISKNLLQWSPLNVITLGLREIDFIFQSYFIRNLLTCKDLFKVLVNLITWTEW
jgi:hypothetical protein